MGAVGRITIVETPEYLARAKRILTSDERQALVSHLSLNPTAGDVMQRTGGARKLRWGTGGKGKSGGVRVVYSYHGRTIPVFLLALFAKNEKINLSESEKRELRVVLSQLADEYRKGVMDRVESRRTHSSRRS